MILSEKNHMIRGIPISSLFSPTLQGPLAAIKNLNQGFILGEPGLIRSHLTSSNYSATFELKKDRVNEISEMKKKNGDPS